MISKGTSTKSEANSYSCKQFAKKPTTKDKTEPLSSQRVGLENGQLMVTWLKHFIMSSEIGKC